MFIKKSNIYNRLFKIVIYWNYAILLLLPVGCPVGWLVGWSVGCPVGWPVGWLVGWPIGNQIIYYNIK